MASALPIDDHLWLMIWSRNSQNDKLRRHVNHQEVTD